MYRAFGKRVLDIIVATISLVLLAVPLVIVAVWIKLDSKGPVLFRHKRAGKNLTPFTVYKFRTMAANAPKHMPTSDFKDAGSYITRSGKILRKLSIDELPQLFNVLKGDMSIVGPRPVVLTEVSLFKEREKYGANDCTPGITGWAQVNGRDELRIKKKAKMDGEYTQNLGLRMDTKCILKTIWAVLFVKGHKEGHHQNIENNRLPQIYKITGKKILFTSHTANFSKFNRPFMRWLRESGNEVHYASAGEEKVLDCDKHFTIPFTRNPFKLSNLNAYKQLKQLINKERYDLIHTHTPMGSVVTRLAAQEARENGTRVIYTAHGFHFFNGASLLNWLIYYPVERYMARHTDTLITINLEDYDRAKRKFKTNVQYIPGVGIDQAKFDKRMTEDERSKLRESLGLKPDDFAMVYLAELSKRKNQLWLINSVAPLMLMNPEFHPLLAGTDSLNGKCQQLVRELCLENNIHFLGYRNDIPELLQSSDVAISSSLQEGLPVNIMEAMYLGIPVVATNCRGNRDLVSDGENGFLVDHDSKVLCERLKILRNNESLKTQFTTSSRHKTKEYLFDKVLAKVSEVYKDAL